MTRAHDTGLGHPKAKDQVVSPQSYVTVPTARGAGLLCIHWVTGESFKNIIRSLYLSKLFLTGNLEEGFLNAMGNCYEVAMLKTGTLNRDVKKTENRCVLWSLLNSLQCLRRLTLGLPGA